MTLATSINFGGDLVRTLELPERSKSAVLRLVSGKSAEIDVRHFVDNGHRQPLTRLRTTYEVREKVPSPEATFNPAVLGYRIQQALGLPEKAFNITITQHTGTLVELRVDAFLTVEQGKQITDLLEAFALHELVTTDDPEPDGYITEVAVGNL